MKKFEGNSIKALLRADDCQSKLLLILPEIISMKQNKANTDDLLKLATAVQRTNYESVYRDLANMINEESKKLHLGLERVNIDMSEQLTEFNKEMTESLLSINPNGIFKDIHQIKSEIESLHNMQALLNEKISRVDYCNMKEDSEFRLEVITKQMKMLENKMLSISCSQESMTDQTVYLRSILQNNNPLNRTSTKPLSTAPTKGLQSDTGNQSQVIEPELSVSGVYLRPNKRVSSASPGKQRVYHTQKKHRIPTSFSNTLSINESPMLWFSKKA